MFHYSAWNLCTWFPYFKAFAFSFPPLVLKFFSACYTSLIFPSSLSCSLISSKIVHPIFPLSCFLLGKSNHKSASNSCMSSSNCFFISGDFKHCQNILIICWLKFPSEVSILYIPLFPLYLFADRSLVMFLFNPRRRHKMENKQVTSISKSQCYKSVLFPFCLQKWQIIYFIIWYHTNNKRSLFHEAQLWKIAWDKMTHSGPVFQGPVAKKYLPAWKEENLHSCWQPKTSNQKKKER